MSLAPSAAILSTPVQFHKNIALSSFESYSRVFHSNYEVIESRLDLVCCFRSSMFIILSPSISILSYFAVNLDISFGLMTLLKPDISASNCLFTEFIKISYIFFMKRSRYSCIVSKVTKIYDPPGFSSMISFNFNTGI
jgi:hypothetical protein